MLSIKLIRSISSWVRAIDDANLPFFRFLSSKTKRKIVRRFFGRFTRRLPETIELNGLQLQIPRSLDYSYVLSEHEPGTQNVIRHHLRHNMRAVDVGANIGYLTLMMAKMVGPEGKIYAVEPGTENLRMLRKNIELNHLKNVTVVPFGAGAIRRTAQLHLRRASTLNTLYQVAGEEDDATVEIEIAPLDDLIPETKIDLLKMDIEGGEVDALQGMSRLIEVTDKMIVEWNPVFLKRAGKEPDALPNALKEYGFHVRVIDESSSQLVEIDQFRHTHEGNHPHVNLFAERL